MFAFDPVIQDRCPPMQIKIFNSSPKKISPKHLKNGVPPQPTDC